MKKLIILAIALLMMSCGGSSDNGGNGSGSGIDNGGDTGDNNGGTDGGQNGSGDQGGNQGGGDTLKDLTPEEILAKLKDNPTFDYAESSYTYLEGSWTVYLFPNEYLGVIQEPQTLTISWDGYNTNHFINPIWKYNEQPYIYGQSPVNFDSCQDLVTDYPQEEQTIINISGEPILFNYSQRMFIDGINDAKRTLVSYLKGFYYHFCCSQQVDGCKNYDMPTDNVYEDTKTFEIAGIMNTPELKSFYIVYDDPHPMTPVYEILFVQQN